MSTRLPERIDPLRLANREAKLIGEVALDGMKRLADTVHSTTGSALVELEFGQDANGQILVSGKIEARLRLLCQRCLEPAGLDVERSVALAVLESPSLAESLAPDTEPLLCTAGSVALADLVEDELLLSLPQEAMHQEGRCAEQHQWTYGGAPQAVEDENRDGPFACLAELKTDLKR